MTNLIDITSIEQSVVQNLQVALSRIRTRTSLDASGAVIYFLTLEEALVLSRDIVVKSVDFRRENIPLYLTQFPEIGECPSDGGSIEQCIEVALHKAMFAHVIGPAHEVVSGQFVSYGLLDIEQLGLDSIVMFEKHLTKCPFASIRIRPNTLREVLDQAIALPVNENLSLLKQQFVALISELRTRSQEARQFARRLREANEFIGLVQQGLHQISFSPVKYAGDHPVEVSRQFA